MTVALFVIMSLLFLIVLCGEVHGKSMTTQMPDRWAVWKVAWDWVMALNLAQLRMLH